jgi:4-phospho-D-threonate 3-dehydrogenase / 4-phospho-D-erythronate 3-dehydrogenase
MSIKPRLAVTMGDPAGIGAEVAVKAFHQAIVFDAALPFVVGSAECLQLAMNETGINLEIRICADLAELKGRPGVIELIDPAGYDMRQHKYGQVSAEAGRAAVGYFETAVNMALKGEIAGVVTCPINKEAVHAAGFVGDIGHQEILARMTGSQLTATMLMTEGLKVAHLSTHKSLIEAAQYVKTEVLLEKLQLTADHMFNWMGRKPKIAVAALNPHGGEGGMLGREEIEQIKPAVDVARASGLDIVGPFPADSVFYRAVAGEFDAVMALYHDQGHIAIKMHNFEASITATMGIPFVRTSVDHGTAFDIAGKNKADARGLGRAIAAAIAMLNGRLD